MTITEYIPKTAMYAVQRRVLEASADLKACAIFLRPRRGKSKIILDTVAYHYRARRVDALVVIASPNGVHRNWVTDEVPAHLPDDVPRRCLIWRAGKYKTSTYAREMQHLIGFRGLAVLAINAEAVNTPSLRKYLKSFMDRRRVFLVGDETSDFMRHPGNVRVKVMLNVGLHKNVQYKRILDGTPMEKPFDIFAQYNFLDKSFLGYGSFQAFKHRYGAWEEGYNRATNVKYPVLKEYQNLGELRDKIARHSFSELPGETSDLPPRVYQPQYFQLGDEARRVYDDLRGELSAILSDGREISVQHVLTRYLRLQQIASGYWPEESGSHVCGDCDGEGCSSCGELGVILSKAPLKRLDSSRLDALAERELRHKGSIIVWARFQQDVTDVVELCTRMGRSPTRYDGLVSFATREEGLRLFQAGRVDALVGSARAGGRGRKMSAATTVVYYSNDWPLLVREQSEMRAESPNKTESTSIVDLVAEDTVDELIVDALRRKRSVVDTLMEVR